MEAPAFIYANNTPRDQSTMPAPAHTRCVSQLASFRAMLVAKSRKIKICATATGHAADQMAGGPLLRSGPY